MLKRLLTLLGIILCFQVNAQNLGIGTITPAAALDVVSTESGVLIPRMTTTQRNLIAVDASLDGMMIYNTTLDRFEFYDHGDGWTGFGGADDLGNHIATQNLQLNSNWLSNDGDGEGIRITDGGSVGIGIANPTHELHVVGNLKVRSGAETGYIQIADEWIGNPGWGTRGVRIGVETDYMYMGMKREGANRNDATILWADDPDDNLRFIHYHYLNGETEQMRIAGDGTVRMTSLAGTGSRMVVADATGDLSTQAIPTGGTNYWTLNGSYIYTRQNDYPRVGINAPNPTAALHIRRQGSDLPLRIANLSNNNSINTVLTVTNQGYVYKRNGAQFSSDIRLKQDIRTIENALDLVLQLRGVAFHYRKFEDPDQNWDPNLQLGVIAQEVETVMPYLVSTDPEGYKAVNYIAFTGLLIESTKILKAENTALKNELTGMQNTLKLLEQRLTRLEEKD